MAIALPAPAARIAATSSSAFCGDAEYVIATAAPSLASRRAIAAPIPRDAPVTNAAFPLSLAISIPFACAQKGEMNAKTPRRQEQQSQNLFVLGVLAFIRIS